MKMIHPPHNFKPFNLSIDTEEEYVLLLTSIKEYQDQCIHLLSPENPIHYQIAKLISCVMYAASDYYKRRDIR